MHPQHDISVSHLWCFSPLFCSVWAGSSLHSLTVISLEDDLEKEACLGGKVRKIQRKDMVCLPRCEWRHANNSFLIHGYYNYHHLILTVRDDRLKLGVPGVYHPQEEKAAESFGFPEFIPAEELDLKLTDEEKNDREKFGYWCRDIRGSHDCVEPQKR